MEMSGSGSFKSKFFSGNSDITQTPFHTMEVRKANSKNRIV